MKHRPIDEPISFTGLELPDMRINLQPLEDDLTVKKIPWEGEFILGRALIPFRCRFLFFFNDAAVNLSFSFQTLSVGCDKDLRTDEPTLRCRQNPLIRALRNQEPVILREPQIKG